MKTSTSARTLIYDIETSPIISYNWGIWQQNAIKVVEDWQILTVAWKWLGDKKVQVIGQDDFKDYKAGVNNDKSITKLIHELFNEADIIVAHNGDSFDQKKCQARMITHDLPPPSPYKQVDTKKLAKRYGAFTSNRLADLAKQLDVSLKGSAGGFETWTGCLAGDKKAWRKMKQYNKQDIPPLEELYLKFRPWHTAHPAVNVMNESPDACPKCGVAGRMHKSGTRTTKTNTYRRYQCQACGGWSQQRTPDTRQTPDRMKYV